MLTIKNLPTWERATRLIAACLMAACGVVFRGEVAGWVLLGASAVTFLTAVVGFCPACAVAGRRPVRVGRGS